MELLIGSIFLFAAGALAMAFYQRYKKKKEQPKVLS
jgi:hypothetical protein